MSECGRCGGRRYVNLMLGVSIDCPDCGRDRRPPWEPIPTAGARPLFEIAVRLHGENPGWSPERVRCEAEAELEAIMQGEGVEDG